MSNANPGDEAVRNEASMRERKAFLLRIDPALHEALEAWAQQEFRSLNGQIEFLLREAVARRRKQEKDEKSTGYPVPSAE